MCLVVAMRLLLTPQMSSEMIACARNYLQAFIDRTPNIYGNEAMVYNMHSLRHVADDFERSGSLDTICSFPYESYLGKLKSYIKRPGKELEQVVKRVQEQCNFQVPPHPQNNFASLLYE